MSTNTLTNRSAGQTILDTFFNDIHTAMNGDFVGRDSSGVAASLQNLGTTALPWGTIRGNALVLDGSAVDVSSIVSPQNRVISGKVRTTSNQPAFITPNGAAASFILDGTPTNLVVDINGTEVTVSTDITKSSLTVAPSSNNTALVDEATAADQYDTKTWGEAWHVDHNYITIDTVGSNITALVGKWAAFKIAGVADEYFLAFVNSATQLNRCFRGFFYNSSLAPINRTGFTNNDTITLMSLAWIFIENNGTTVDVTYNNPTWSFTSPSSPATGDYWYDMGNETWKRYDGASFQIINRTWVGMAIIDTANCIGARCVDFHAAYKSENSLATEISTTEIVRTTEAETRVSVAGMDIRFRNSLALWNITTDLASSADMYDATEQASRFYYLYLKDDSDTVISDIQPYYRKDFFGWYHPHNPWRAVGIAFNNGSSNLTLTYPVERRLGENSILRKSVFTGSGTFTRDSTMLDDTVVKITVIGGGGNGGDNGTDTDSGGAGGGGGGGAAIKWVTGKTIGASQTVTVGAATGTTSVGSLAVATGGSSGSNADTTAQGALGGAGGVGTTGDILLQGNYGENGDNTITGVFFGTGGLGGQAALGGGGGSSPRNAGSGSAGGNYGGGGGGATGNSGTGGAGAGGLAFLEWIG